MPDTKILFKPIKIGGTVLKNRIIMPSMATNFANTDGTPSRKLLNYYAERARGGCGLIITEGMSVSNPTGSNLDRTLTLKSVQHVQEWHELVETVHSFGTKIVAQIYNADKGLGSLAAMSTEWDNLLSAISKMKGE